MQVSKEHIWRSFNSFIKLYCYTDSYYTTRVDINNITGPQARYLDQGLWAIAVSEPIEMEIQCQIHKSVKTLQPPMAMVTLEPTCSAFSSAMKLPPHFRQYPNGFDVALRAANIHVPKFNSSSFRIKNHFSISNLTVAVTRKLQKLPPTPSVPVDQMKAQIPALPVDV